MNTIILLKMLSETKWIADKTTLIRLYLALVKPKLDYDREAYGSASKTYLESSQSVQNAALRISLGAFNNSLIIAGSRLLLLDNFRGIHKMKYYLRAKANTEKTIFNKLNVHYE